MAVKKTMTEQQPENKEGEVKKTKKATKTAAKTTTKVAKTKAEKPKTKKTAAKAATEAAPKVKRTRKTKTAEASKEEKPKVKKTVKKKTTQAKADATKIKTETTENTEEVTEAAKIEIIEEPKVKEVHEEVVENVQTEETEGEPMMGEYEQSTPRKSVAFIGSECYPFVKTGGLGDVMYALPKALIKQNCDVKVIIPRYKCIPWEYQEKMIYRGSFNMEVVYDFIDNEEFFSEGNPYTSIVGDIPKYCYFAKAALAALNYMNWIPDIIHCHDWQAALVPVYLRTLFENTPVSSAKTILTIHNLRFQGIYNIPTIRYWSGLPEYVFNKDALKQGYEDANMLKGGLTYCNMITTVSHTYADEIQTEYYGENLHEHLRYHSGKLRGIVNGIDVDIWNTYTDPRLAVNYDITNVLDKKRENKRALQEELGLWQDDHKFVIGLISRLTDQKGLDLVNAIIPEVMDDHTQIVVLGTGDPQYEDSFRYYENAYRGNVCSNIMYDETRAHKIYAGADALLVPSQFEPCGLTQLIAMHYGTVPIVRETGGLKDTVQPYNVYTNDGNGFTFDHYDAGLLLDAINRAKTLYFTNRWCWDEMVQRNMAKDVSWENSAKQYKDLYLELCW